MSDVSFPIDVFFLYIRYAFDQLVSAEYEHNRQYTNVMKPLKYFVKRSDVVDIVSSKAVIVQT